MKSGTEIGIATQTACFYFTVMMMIEVTIVITVVITMILMMMILTLKGAILACFTIYSLRNELSPNVHARVATAPCANHRQHVGCLSQATSQPCANHRQHVGCLSWATSQPCTNQGSTLVLIRGNITTMCKSQATHWCLSRATSQPCANHRQHIGAYHGQQLNHVQITGNTLVLITGNITTMYKSQATHWCLSWATAQPRTNIQATQWVLMGNMSCVTWYERTAQQLLLTEMKLL